MYIRIIFVKTGDVNYHISYGDIRNRCVMRKEGKSSLWLDFFAVFWCKCRMTNIVLYYVGIYSACMSNTLSIISGEAGVEYCLRLTDAFILNCFVVFIMGGINTRMYVCSSRSSRVSVSRDPRSSAAAATAEWVVKVSAGMPRCNVHIIMSPLKRTESARSLLPAWPYIHTRHYTYYKKSYTIIILLLQDIVVVRTMTAAVRNGL